MADTLDRIIAAEWLQFGKVQNMNGRAACQDDLRTFTIMRASQLGAWDEALRRSYEADLEAAEARGRNLLSEKYAYMMEYSAPADFKRIAPLLYGISPQKRRLIDEIVRVMVPWQREVQQRFPAIAARSRGLSSIGDSPDNVSFESYLRGELATYSQSTLHEYKRLIEEVAARQENLCEKILTNTARLYGYKSLEDAEQKLERL